MDADSNRIGVSGDLIRHIEIVEPALSRSRGTIPEGRRLMFKSSRRKDSCHGPAEPLNVPRPPPSPAYGLGPLRWTMSARLLGTLERAVDIRRPWYVSQPPHWLPCASVPDYIAPKMVAPCDARHRCATRARNLLLRGVRQRRLYEGEAQSGKPGNRSHCG